MKAKRKDKQVPDKKIPDSSAWKRQKRIQRIDFWITPLLIFGLAILFRRYVTDNLFALIVCAAIFGLVTHHVGQMIIQRSNPWDYFNPSYGLVRKQISAVIAEAEEAIVFQEGEVASMVHHYKDFHETNYIFWLRTGVDHFKEAIALAEATRSEFDKAKKKFLEFDGSRKRFWEAELNIARYKTHKTILEVLRNSSKFRKQMVSNHVQNVVIDANKVQTIEEDRETYAWKFREAENQIEENQKTIELFLESYDPEYLDDLQDSLETQKLNMVGVTQYYTTMATNFEAKDFNNSDAYRIHLINTFKELEEQLNEFGILKEKIIDGETFYIQDAELLSNEIEALIDKLGMEDERGNTSYMKVQDAFREIEELSYDGGNPENEFRFAIAPVVKYLEHLKSKDTKNEATQEWMDDFTAHIADIEQIFLDITNNMTTRVEPLNDDEEALLSKARKLAQDNVQAMIAQENEAKGSLTVYRDLVFAVEDLKDELKEIKETLIPA